MDYILCSERWRSSIQSTKTRPGADCGSDHELLISKLRLKLKSVGKTNKPFTYDYTLKVTNRFKGLDQIESLNNSGWRFVMLYKRWWPKPSLRKREVQEGKMVVWGGLTNSWEKKRGKRQRKKERYTHLNAEFQRIARRDKKTFFRDQWKEIEENNRMGKTGDLFKKIRESKGTFHAKMGITDRNGPNRSRRY